MTETTAPTEVGIARARKRPPTGRTMPPIDRLETVESWGRASRSAGYVYRPSTLAGVNEAIRVARESGYSIGLRGSGNSYGDAPYNDENLILDTSRMNRVLAWDPEIGRVKVEPGVTMAQLWQYILGDGWWPAVVPGTSKPTLGGCAGMNIHGKNAWKAGTIGDHIYEIELLLPSGQKMTCSRTENPELFFAAIGGFGILGIIVSITLGLQRVYSGFLQVEALASRNLSEMMEQFEDLKSTSDYLVGWIDAFGSGKGIGRGQVHKANYLPAGEVPYPDQGLKVQSQHLGDSIFGVVPRSSAWRFMKPFMNDLSVRFVNLGKYWSSRLTHGRKYRQTHASFHFLLDYLPDWKLSYGKGGLIQYQSFIPKETALDAFGEMLSLCRRRGVTNYLSVLKRHRRDDFLISHGVDGYSLAMDFRVTARRRPKLVRLSAELDRIVLEAGGRFYFAKDSTLRPEIVRQFLGEETVSTLFELKTKCDPENRLQTNLWRRLFRP